MSKLYNSTAEWTDGKCGAGDDGGAAISPRSSPQLLIISDISQVARRFRRQLSTCQPMQYSV